MERQVEFDRVEDEDSAKKIKAKEGRKTTISGSEIDVTEPVDKTKARVYNYRT